MKRSKYSQMNLKQQVIDHVLNLQQKQQTKVTQVNMRLALLGTEKSGKAEFFQYVQQYLSFNSVKTKEKHCVFSIPQCQMDIFMLHEEFANQFAALRCASAVMFFRSSDKNSIKYVSKNLSKTRRILQKQLDQLNHQQNSVETASDLCDFFTAAEAEPMILVIAIIDDDSDISKIKQQIFDENQRLQEINEINDNCINILQVLCKSLTLSYSEFYFQKLEEQWGQSSSGCGSQAM